MKKYLICILVCLSFPLSARSEIPNEFIPDRSAQRLDIPGQVNSISWQWEGDIPWLTGVNWGGIIFNGGLHFGNNFLGSSILAENVPNVEIRFSNTETSQAYIYRRDLGYSYAGLGTFPGSAWDISNPENPRRLDICFTEWSDTAGGKIANQKWDPDDSEMGKREYLFIMNTNYNPVANDPFYSQKSIYNEGDQFPVLYSLWPAVVLAMLQSLSH